MARCSARSSMTVLHGVRPRWRSGKPTTQTRARAARNPDDSPNIKFADFGGYGYTTVRASPEELETEFVCIPRPMERSDAEDGGPLVYRAVHRVRLWAPASGRRCGRKSSRATPGSRSDAPRVSTEFPPVGVGRRNRDRVNRVTLAVKRGSSYVPQGLRACCRVGASCAVGVRTIRRHHRCIGRQRACRRALRRKSGLVAERHPLRRSRRRRQA